MEFAHFLAQRGEEKKEVRRDITHAGKRNKKESPHGSGIKKNPTLEREEKENLKSVTFERKQFWALGRIPEIKSRVHQQRCVRDTQGKSHPYATEANSEARSSPTL